jgi:hypothetical protein
MESRQWEAVSGVADEKKVFINYSGRGDFGFYFI